MSVGLLLVGIAEIAVGAAWSHFASREKGDDPTSRAIRISRVQGWIVMALGLFMVVASIVPM